MKRISMFMLTMMFVLSAMLMCVSPATAHVRGSSEKMYQMRGGTLIGNYSERIDYTRKEMIGPVVLFPQMPGYISAYTCGITAGGNIVAWYNKDLDLIDNHTPGTQRGNVWSWTSQNTAINNMFADLETRMGGNGSTGVTILQYTYGMASFAASRGYTLSTTGARAGNNAMNSAFFTAIGNNKPTTLFLDGFNIIAFSAIGNYPNYDTFLFSEYAGAHVMVAYGYVEFEYYEEVNNIEVMFRKDTYLYVQTGISGTVLALLRINAYCTLDDAYVTHIS